MNLLKIDVASEWTGAKKDKNQSHIYVHITTPTQVHPTNIPAVQLVLDLGSPSSYSRPGLLFLTDTLALWFPILIAIQLHTSYFTRFVIRPPNGDLDYRDTFAPAAALFIYALCCSLFQVSTDFSLQVVHKPPCGPASRGTCWRLARNAGLQLSLAWMLREIFMQLVDLSSKDSQNGIVRSPYSPNLIQTFLAASQFALFRDHFWS